MTLVDSANSGAGEVVDPLMEKVISLYEKKFQAGELKILTPEESRLRNKQARQETRDLIALAKSKAKLPSP